jgi:hypothetical protein
MFVLIVAACKSLTPAERMDSLQSWLATARHVIERIPGSGDGRPTMDTKVHPLVGTKVHDVDGRKVGRIEEIRVADFCALDMSIQCTKFPGRRVDVTDPKRPVLRIAQRDMRHAR